MIDITLKQRTNKLLSVAISLNHNIVQIQFVLQAITNTIRDENAKSKILEEIKKCSAHTVETLDRVDQYFKLIENDE